MLTKEQIKKRQDIAGGTFVFVVVIDVIVRLLKLVNVVDELMSWYIVPVGVMAVFGFYLLYSIASNSTAEIFAVCQGVIVAFFSLLATFVIYAEINSRDSLNTPTLLMACMGFLILSMYIHTVLLSSGKFSMASLQWIALVPLPYVGDVCRYYCWLQNYTNSTTPLGNWEVGNLCSQYLSWFVLLVSAVGCWRLCHSEPFSAKNDDFSIPHWSPLNRYFVGYAIAILSIFLIY